LLREIDEETGIKIIKSNNEEFEYSNILQEKCRVELQPFMLYESVYPDFLQNGLPTAQCLALFYKLKIDSDKNYIDVTYQKEEVCSFTWINFENLYSSLFKKEKLNFDVNEYENGMSKPFRQTTFDESILVNWDKEGLGIPIGHVLAIKGLYAKKDILNDQKK